MEEERERAEAGSVASTDGNGWGDDENDFLAREMAVEWGK